MSIQVNYDYSFEYRRVEMERVEKIASTDLAFCLRCKICGNNPPHEYHSKVLFRINFMSYFYSDNCNDTSLCSFACMKQMDLLYRNLYVQFPYQIYPL